MLGKGIILLYCVWMVTRDVFIMQLKISMIGRKIALIITDGNFICSN